MKSQKTGCSALFLLGLALFSCGKLAARNSPVTLTLGSSENAKAIPPLFSGISMETEIIRPAADGSYYFCPKNTRLAAVLKQLGVKHVRIGGNTVDDKTKTPELADIDQLFAFAKMAGVK